MGQMRNSYKILVVKPEEKRGLLRSRGMDKRVKKQCILKQYK
jgi:hypothetical protein